MKLKIKVAVETVYDIYEIDVDHPLAALELWDKGGTRDMDQFVGTVTEDYKGVSPVIYQYV